MGYSNLVNQLGSRIGRRQFLQMSVAGASSAALATLLSACGGGGSSSTSTSSQILPPPASSTSQTGAATETTISQTAVASCTTSTSSQASATTAASTSTSQAASSGLTKVIIGQGIGLKSLDPHEDTSGAAANVFIGMFDHLVGRDQDLKYVPGLAESWKMLDGTTWEFKIRKNVKFHDGTPLTANDAKFTIQHILDPNAKSREYTRFTYH